MARFAVFIILTAGSPAVLLCQSGMISPKGVLNAASYAPPGLPHGSIARGSVFSIFGNGLGPPPPSPSLAFPLSTTLGGVSIRVFQGATSVNAIPVFVSPAQINAIMPSNAPLGRVSVQVTFNNLNTNPAPVTVVNASFGIYTATGLGLGPGILQNFVSPTSQPINAPALAAMPGQVITLWGTGLGPAPFPDNVAPTAMNLATQTEVFVGGQSASVAYFGRSPCCSGSDQIVFTIPANAPLGCWVPVFVRTEGKTVSNSVTISINADGSPCSEPTNPLATGIVAGGKIGSVRLVRSVVHDEFLKDGPVDFTTDLSYLTFWRDPGGSYAFDPAVFFPPPGTCTVYGLTGNLRNRNSPPLLPSSRQYLDAGTSFTVAGPSGSRLITTFKQRSPDVAQLGKIIPNSGLRDSSLLVPGAYTVTSKGGADIGAIQAALNLPAPLSWTNESQISAIDRTQPLTLTWSGAPVGQPVIITGGVFDQPNNAGTNFICIAPPGVNSFTVPAYAMANIQGANPFTMVPSTGTVTIGALNAPLTFSADGLDLGVASLQSFLAKHVTFK